MGFSFRKSIKIGPVRLNVSKSGLGASAGVKGARVGVNAKGNSYSSFGAKGMYYRSQSKGSAQAPVVENDYAQSDLSQNPVIIGISFAITLALFSWFLGFFSSGLKLVLLVLSGIILLGTIVIGLTKLRRKTPEETEVFAPDEYSETIRAHIIQDEQLSHEDIEALIVEYCQNKGLLDADSESMKRALLKERENYQEHKQ